MIAYMMFSEETTTFFPATLWQICAFSQYCDQICPFFFHNPVIECVYSGVVCWKHIFPMILWWDFNLSSFDEITELFLQTIDKLTFFYSNLMNSWYVSMIMPQRNQIWCRNETAISAQIQSK